MTLTLVGAAVVYPAILLLACGGAGLLIDRLAGGWLPGAVLPALGAAGLICLSQLMTIPAATAPLTPWAVAIVAVAGLVAGRGRLRDLGPALRRTPWPGLLLVAVYGVAIAPVLLSGRPTLTNYLLDTNPAIHLAGADFLLHNGRDFARLDLDTSAGIYVQRFFGADYPAGSHTLLGATGALVPVPLIWLYQPFVAAMLALASGPLWVLARRLGLSGFLAALAVGCSCVPALVYAYNLVGSIKEITTIPLILLTGALVVEHRRWTRRGPRAALPFALVTAAGLGAIGVAFGGWVIAAVAVLMCVVAVDLRAGEVQWRRLGLLVVAGVVIGLVAALPTVQGLGGAVSAAQGIAVTSDPGNLPEPLRTQQALGVWIDDQYLLLPDEHLRLTYGLIGVTFVAILLGAVELVRRRRWVLVGWLALVGALWWELSRRGTTWTDSKLIVLSSSVVVLLAWGGVAALVNGRRRWEAYGLAAVLAFGVAYSAALQYHGTNLAPTARFDELADINERFAGRGPTLTPDFDEYVIHQLRDLAPSGPGLAFVGAELQTAYAGYGNGVDLDSVPIEAIRRQKLIVVRRNPVASRPPADFERRWRGRFYEVWERRTEGPAVLAHLPLIGARASRERPDCDEVTRLARVARAGGGRLVAAPGTTTVAIDPAITRRSPGWGAGPDGVSLVTPGELAVSFRVRQGGRWRLWLGGQVSRPLTVVVDGREIGRGGYQLAGRGNFLTPFGVQLAPGSHDLRIRRGGGGLHPGDGAPSSLTRIVLEPDRPDPALVSVAPADARSLCRRELDWVAAVGAPGGPPQVAEASSTASAAP